MTMGKMTTVGKRELRSAIATAKRFMARGGSVRLDATPDRLTLMATDFEIGCEIDIPADGMSTWSTTVDPKVLAPILKGRTKKGETIDLALSSEGLPIVGGIPVAAGGAVPDLPPGREVALDEGGSLSPDDFAVLLAVAKARADDNDRGIGGIYLDGATVSATDRHRLHRAALRFGGRPVTFGARLVGVLPKLGKQLDGVPLRIGSVEGDPGRIWIQCPAGGITIYGDEAENDAILDYLKTEKGFCADKPARLLVSAVDLRAAVEAIGVREAAMIAGHLEKTPGCRLELALDDGGPGPGPGILSLSGEHDDELAASICPLPIELTVFAEGEPCVRHLHPRYLAEAIDFAGPGQIRVEMFDIVVRIREPALSDERERMALICKRKGDETPRRRDR